MVPELKPLSPFTQSCPQISHSLAEKLLTTHPVRDSAYRPKKACGPAEH